MANSVSPLARFIAELHRRRVFRTAALYILGAWLALQLADVVFPALDIPERAIRYVLIAAVLGFPGALIFGWFYDITPGGVLRTPPASDPQSPDALSLRRSDYLLLTALLLLAGGIVYNAATGVVKAPVSEPTPEPRPSGPPVVAVLPFVTHDPEGDSRFFANGVHDDLITSLAKLETIRVISRTSVMEYTGSGRNLREIGAELGSDVVLEGGVQVDGDRIRINAQLIDNRSDEHLWAESYDRELAPGRIFEVQQDIARSITAALRARLSAEDEKSLSVIPTESMPAYRAYREAMHNRGGYRRSADRIAELRKAVEYDPEFAGAWAELAGVYALGSNKGQIPERVAHAEEALEKVRQLAPDSAEYLIAQT